MDDLIHAILQDLQGKYRPHTVILYGSRAIGEATQASDIDIACFSDHAREGKDARLFQGVYLDAWIYPTEQMVLSSDNVLRFAEGYCLVDERGLGEVFLTAIRDKLSAGPARLTESDHLHTVEWVSKMLQRVEMADLEACYRRCWLQFELLEIYFQLRTLWYFGPKKSLNFLKQHDRIAYQLFADVYQNPKDTDKLKTLAKYVVRV